MVLERELEYFEQQKTELLLHYKGQFALIKDNELLGTYTTPEQAFSAGVRALGNQPFLIKKVQEKEEVIYFPTLSTGMLRVDP